MPRVRPLPEGLSYAGKTALVTGANVGLGFAIALLLLRHNISCLILGVRTASKGEATKELLLADPQVKALKETPQILVYTMDMLSHESVVEFSKSIVADIPKLDIAILNGTFAKSPSTGNEAVFQVNHLSTAILAIYLLPLLRKSSVPGSPSHLTVESSRSQERSPILGYPIPDDQPLFEWMNDPQTFSLVHRYEDSKLFIGMFVRALAKHVDVNEVLVNDMCPGFVATELDRDLNWIVKYLLKFARYLLAKTPEQGATLTLHALEAGKESHGRFVACDTIQPFFPFETSEKGKLMASKLWKETTDVASRLIPASIEAAIEKSS
ncbi:NAD(P)-binding protein [Hymenopellis radicata]|nr:NAD(P)-binding protein [Hymenopellis radicata]